jgi:hypothetical protein
MEKGPYVFADVGTRSLCVFISLLEYRYKLLQRWISCECAKEGVIFVTLVLIKCHDIDKRDEGG